MGAREGGLTMMDRRAALALFLIPLAGAGHASAAPAGKPADGSPSVARATVDPQPPLALAIEVTGLEKHARGGIASIALAVSAEVEVREGVLTVTAPGDLRFADGSSVRTFKVEIEAGGMRIIPLEVLVPRDGRYAVTATIEGESHGRALRRGAAGTLEVGRRAAPPKSRDGAIEYVAIEAAGATGEVQP